MAGETVITVVGNLVDDPELRFTPSGSPSTTGARARLRRAGGISVSAGVRC